MESSSTNGNDYTYRNDGRNPTNWIGWKDRGTRAYGKGDYETALDCFRRALYADADGDVYVSSRAPPLVERQRLLANVVACELHLERAEEAVADAERCIALNDRWAKGHLRLAEAYIALGKRQEQQQQAGGDNNRNRSRERTARSNDACNALQTALRLDPGNRKARDLLVRELRSGKDRERERAARHDANGNGNGNGNGNNAGGNAGPQPSAPPEYMDDVRYEYSGGRRSSGSGSGDSARVPQRDSRAEHQQQQHQQQRRHEDHRHRDGDRRRRPFGNHTDTNRDTDMDMDMDRDIDTDIDDAIPWRQRLGFSVQRARMWYAAQSEDVKSLLKVGLVLMLLYVAFGGRFGLERVLGGNAPGRSGGSRSRGDEVYREFYRSRNGDRDPNRNRDRHQRHNQNQNQNHNNYNYNPRGNRYGSGHRDSYDSSHSSSSHSSSSSHTHRRYSSSPSRAADPDWCSNLLLVAGVIGCARWLGIRPFQAVWLVNLLTGRRLFRGAGGFFRGGFGGGFGGYRRHRPGGMWR